MRQCHGRLEQKPKGHLAQLKALQVMILLCTTFQSARSIHNEQTLLEKDLTETVSLALPKNNH